VKHERPADSVLVCCARAEHALAAVLALYASLAASHLAAFLFELVRGKRAPFAAFYDATLLVAWTVALVRASGALLCGCGSPPASCGLCFRVAPRFLLLMCPTRLQLLRSIRCHYDYLHLPISQLIAYLSSKHGIAMRWRLLTCAAMVVYAASLALAMRGRAAKAHAQPHVVAHAVFAAVELALSLCALVADYSRWAVLQSQPLHEKF